MTDKSRVIGGQYAKRNFKTFDVTNLIRVSRKRKLKFNMLLDYCIGRAAVKVKEFYILPVGDKLIQYDTIAVNTIVKNKEGEVSSCDLSYKAELNQFNKEYLKYTTQVAASCQDRDLSENSMVIGTSAIIDTDLIPVPSHAAGRRTRRHIFEKPAERDQSAEIMAE